MPGNSSLTYEFIDLGDRAPVRRAGRGDRLANFLQCTQVEVEGAWYLFTGGAGFIGSNFVLDWLKHSDEPVVNLDKLNRH